MLSPTFLEYKIVVGGGVGVSVKNEKVSFHVCKGK